MNGARVSGYMPPEGFENARMVEFAWCAECLQGVEWARWTADSELHDFWPCGHRAKFYEVA